MSKLKIGDVIEFQTSGGYAYAQVTHHSERYGHLLRVFSKICASPQSACDVIAGEPAFKCFFPVSIALHRKLVRLVGNEPVPEQDLKFPVFRSGLNEPGTNKVRQWWFWDGTKSWPVGRELTSEELKYPLKGIWNDTLIIERIENGYTAERDPRN